MEEERRSFGTTSNASKRKSEATPEGLTKSKVLVSESEGNKSVKKMNLSLSMV